MITTLDQTVFWTIERIKSSEGTMRLNLEGPNMKIPNVLNCCCHGHGFTCDNLHMNHSCVPDACLKCTHEVALTKRAPIVWAQIYVYS